MTEHWNNDVKYLKGKTGDVIVAEQRTINNQVDSFVTATQIFPKGDELYDAFIYYKKRPKAVTINDDEEKAKYNIKEAGQ